MNIEDKKRNFMLILNERIQMSSSISTNSAYEIVKATFERIFDKPEEIEQKLYTADEVETLCRSAVDENMFILRDEHDGWGEIDEEAFKKWVKENLHKS